MDLPLEQKAKLFNRDFFLLWQGQFVSQIGSQAFAIAMMFWIKHETGSASLMGLLMTVSMLPAVILGPVAGVVADRFSRKMIIVLSDIFRGIPVIFIALLIFWAPISGKAIIICLFLVTLILGILGAFFQPAIGAAIPDIVPKDRVASANSLNQSSRQISLFIGQALGGYLFVILGAPLLFLIDGITYLFSAFSESFIKIPQAIPGKSRRWADNFRQFNHDLKDGLRFTWNHTGLRALIITAAFVNFFATPIIILLPFYVEDFLHVRADWYGYILAGFGLGSLLGYAAAGVIRLPEKIKSRIFIIDFILMSACFPVFSLLKNAVAALLLMTLLGVLNGYFNINIITVLQLLIPGEIRGRVFGLFITLTAGLTPVSMGLSGIIADLVNQNIPLIYAVCGLITLLFALAMAFNRDFRQFLQLDKDSLSSEIKDLNS
jgi:DHA3 family macrolide efflux protein-like MFS transporter